MPPTPETDLLDPTVRRVMLESGALLEGHFSLTSGRHSNRYFQAMKILQNPAWANEAARSIAGRVGDLGVGVTLSPAVGGIVWGWAVAQHLPGARAIFAERVDGVMTLRRTFELGAGERVLLTEDVITTGGSVLEVKALAEAAGATVVGVACVMDRSGGAFDPGVPVFAWGRMLVESWAAGECPLCAAGSTAVKPGSRAIKA